jgi:WD40 repeat protein
MLRDVNTLTYYAYVGGFRPAFSPDGKTLVIGDSWGSVNFYHTASWTMKKDTLGPSHRSAVLKLAVSPDGRTILTKGLDKTLRRWDLAGRGEPEIVQQFRLPKNLLAFSPNGKAFAAADSPTLAWKAETGDKLFDLRGDLWSLLYSPDSKTIIGETLYDHVVHVWDARTGRELHRFPPLKDGNNALAFSADGVLLAAVDSTGKVVVWNTVTGIQSASWTADRACSAAFAPGGETLAIGHPSGTITFWNAATGGMERSLRAHRGPVFQLRFTPDGETLLSCGTDGVIQVRRPDHDRPRAVIPIGPENLAGPPVTFDLDASGQYLFASGPTPLVYVHRLPPE